MIYLNCVFYLLFCKVNTVKGRIRMKHMNYEQNGGILRRTDENGEILIGMYIQMMCCLLHLPYLYLYSYLNI